MRPARHHRPRGGGGVLQGEQGRLRRGRARRRRWSPASWTISKPRVSRRSARARRRRGSKAPRASPRTCAARTTFRPPPMSASPRPSPRRPTRASKTTPIVIKADGLAAGKGVVIAETIAEAEAAIDMMFGGGLGDAGAEVVIEEFLVGEEASFFALCDGETAIPLGVGAGPQARVRRRPGPEHRRHGRLFARAGDDAGDHAAARWTRSCCRRCAR